MIDLDASESAALLALISWWEQAPNGAVWDRSHDIHLRGAARRLAHPAPATRKVDGARKATERTVEERTLLLAWLITKLKKGAAHLEPAARGGALFPWVVCIHEQAGPMTWRITDNEAHNYFGHLKRQPCDKPLSTREDKLTRLAALVSAKR